MGNFSYVDIHESLMPEEFRELTGWQTKSVIDPMFSTLVVDEDGNLANYMHWFGNVAFEALDFTGEMYFHTFRGEHSAFGPYEPLVCLVAEFVDGKLISIKED